MSRWPGRLITKTPVTPGGPTATGSAPGMWTIPEVAYWVKQGVWPDPAIVPDPYWSYVSYLLGTTATNAAQNNTFLDSSTNNLTVTRVGTATQGSVNPYGTLWSVYLDGSGDYLTAPTNAAYDVSGGDYTIEAWINFSALPAANNSGNRVAGVGIYSSGFGGGWEVALDLTQNLVSIGQPGSASLTSASYTFAIGQWYHVAVCRASGTNRIFVNGTSLTLTTNTFPNNATGSAQLRIGAGLFSGGYEHYFPGYISNFRLVKGTGLYSSNFTPSTTPLTAVSGTSILTAQSNRFKDNSTNNATVTSNGDARVTAFSPFILASPGYSGATYGGSLYIDAQGTTTTVPNVYAATSTGLDLQTTGTLEFWVYPTARATGASSPLNDASNMWAFYGTDLGSVTKYFGMGISSTGYLYISVDATSGAAGNTSTTFIPLNTWTHIAWVRSGGANKFYVNGADVTSTFSNPSVSGLWPTTATTNRAYIGVVPYLWGSYTYLYPFAGYISNFRVVKGTAVYTSAFTPPTTPLTAITNTSLLLNFTNAGIFDASMNSDMETVGNAQVSTGQAKFGTTSAYFDGSGDYLNTAASSSLGLTGDWTVEGWLYQTSTAGTQIFLDTRGSGATGFGIYCSLTGYAGGPGALGYATNSALVATSSTAIPLNTWTHLAVTRSGNTVTGYINGVSAFTYTESRTLSSTMSYFIGADYTGGANIYGYIDDLRITKGYARYTANFTPPTAPLPPY